MAAFAVTKPGCAIFAHAVHAHDRCVLITRNVICARCVCQMMFNRSELDLVRINAEPAERGENIANISAKSAISVEQRGERAIRGVPMPRRIMPSRGPENADRGEG